MGAARLLIVMVMLCAALVAQPAAAGEKFALVITGASGGTAYAERYDGWRKALVSILRERFDYPAERVVVLAETEADGTRKATRENVRATLGDFARRLEPDDQLLVVLMGHGSTADGEDAKFNLVGPDLSATEWAGLLRAVRGRLVFVNTSSASFPFVRQLAGRNRIVITATDSAPQQFETVFADHFIKAFDDLAADLDKNGRVSVWEAFTYASAGVHDYFEQRGQLPTERAVVDDNGDGIGRDAEVPGDDGALARATFLDPDPVANGGADGALGALTKREAQLVNQVEVLKARKPQMSEDDYENALEKVLLELARVSRQIRSRS